MTDERIAELLGWPRGHAHRDDSLMHRIRIVVDEAQAERGVHIYRLREQTARDTAQIERLLAEVERLRAELAESKQDTARYRWLRDKSLFDLRSALAVGDFTALDAAIDAMRKEGGE